MGKKGQPGVVFESGMTFVNLGVWETERLSVVCAVGHVEIVLAIWGKKGGGRTKKGSVVCAVAGELQRGLVDRGASWAL